jgi:hypothetical protein
MVARRGRVRVRRGCILRARCRSRRTCNNALGLDGRPSFVWCDAAQLGGETGLFPNCKPWVGVRIVALAGQGGFSRRRTRFRSLGLADSAWPPRFVATASHSRDTCCSHKCSAGLPGKAYPVRYSCTQWPSLLVSLSTPRAPSDPHASALAQCCLPLALLARRIAQRVCSPWFLALVPRRVCSPWLLALVARRICSPHFAHRILLTASARRVCSPRRLAALFSPRLLALVARLGCSPWFLALVPRRVCSPWLLAAFARRLPRIPSCTAPAKSI